MVRGKYGTAFMKKNDNVETCPKLSNKLFCKLIKSFMLYSKYTNIYSNERD